MTTDQSLRATLHVIGAMQLDALAVLQAGTMKGADVQRLLNLLEFFKREVEAIAGAAVNFPEQYRQYAAPGQVANEPSEN